MNLKNNNEKPLSNKLEKDEPNKTFNWTEVNQYYLFMCIYIYSCLNV